MEKNIVFGVYRFLGFHLCNFLLEQGYEVVGSDWLENESEYEEEKKLMFGRNANFSFYSDERFENDKITMYICLYDYLDNPSFSLEQLEELFAYINCIMEKCNQDGMQIVVFLPEEYNSSMKRFFDEWKVKNDSKNIIRCIHLSELYGPWLPSYKSIQRILKQDISVLKANMSKYIYVDDFFQSWKSIMALQKNDVFVIGKQAENWRQQLLQLVNIEDDEALASGRTAADWCVDAKTSLIEGFQLVMEHNEKLELLQN